MTILIRNTVIGPVSNGPMPRVVMRNQWEQYIASAIMVMAERKGWTLAGKTIGVVGVGNVGSKVATIAEILGMRVLLNDPPRARVEGEKGFVFLDKILEESDIITLHVPLNQEGLDATWHLADEVVCPHAAQTDIHQQLSRRGS